MAIREAGEFGHIFFLFEKYLSCSQSREDTKEPPFENKFLDSRILWKIISNIVAAILISIMGHKAVETPFLPVWRPTFIEALTR